MRLDGTNHDETCTFSLSLTIPFRSSTMIENEIEINIATDFVKSGMKSFESVRDCHPISLFHILYLTVFSTPSAHQRAQSLSKYENIKNMKISHLQTTDPITRKGTK